MGCNGSTKKTKELTKPVTSVCSDVSVEKKLSTRTIGGNSKPVGNSSGNKDKPSLNGGAKDPKVALRSILKPERNSIEESSHEYPSDRGGRAASPCGGGGGASYGGYSYSGGGSRGGCGGWGGD
ncbi:unnamed protein product [Moneuplotes crassus]|uniref:Uncharacterized protein n=1 Tax=Euplotes crassus TaxID=5936 RepID=A0AAD1XJZ1_EUPCR|nr:unnamed protein product [Moneuplotes crassus]